MRAVAESIHTAARSEHGIGACWAWDIWCGARQYEKVWFIVHLLLALTLKGKSLNILTTADEEGADACPVTLEAWEEWELGTLCFSLHPCMHWLSNEAARRLHRESLLGHTSYMRCPLWPLPPAGAVHVRILRRGRVADAVGA